CEANRVTRPLDLKAKEESFASQNANGTGPFMLVSRQPGVKTVFKRNPNYWGKADPTQGNVQDLVFLP
ncbi:ABC transporter substrate-binding protein, partial [Enterobacter cloacae]